MDETNEATHTARAKDEFFSAGMYMFRVTGFPQQPGVLTHQAEAPQGARLDVWRTDPASNRHIPGPGAEGVAFSTQSFSLINSGNRTLHAPKRSWKITLEHAAGGADHLAGMTRVNLKSMYNDPSQMREALAWRLFRNAGVPAARHTYAKLAFDATYYGLFSVIEQVDKRFLKDHFGDNDRGNLYKAYCGDVGCATLEHRAGPDGDDSGRQYYQAPPTTTAPTGSRPTRTTTTPAPTMTWRSSSGRSTARGSAAARAASTPMRSASRSTAS